MSSEWSLSTFLLGRTIRLQKVSVDWPLIRISSIFAIQAIDDKDSHMFPLDMHQIGKKQLTDELLQQKLKDKKLKEYFGKMQFDNV